MSELAVYHEEPLTASMVKAQVNLIQEVMAVVMKNGDHYGIIPGCGDKPTLLKPGAEKLCSTFRMAPDPVIEDLGDFDTARYRVTCRMLSQQAGSFLGAGVGECSSNEEKYRWKKAVCDEEWDETPDGRRNVWKRGKGGKGYQVKQVRTNPADVANTVLKMAKKRALIDAVLTITAASDIFAQDLEDEPGAVVEQTAKPEKKITKPQLNRLFAIAGTKGIDEDAIRDNLAAKMDYTGSLKDLPRSLYERVVEGLEKMPDKVEEPSPEAQVEAQFEDENE